MVEDGRNEVGAGGVGCQEFVKSCGDEVLADGLVKFFECELGVWCCTWGVALFGLSIAWLGGEEFVGAEPILELPAIAGPYLSGGEGGCDS